MRDELRLAAVAAACVAPLSGPVGMAADGKEAKSLQIEGSTTVGPIAVLGLAKALERIGDLCTNIAEDVIFLRTGDIIRHRTAAPAPTPPDGGNSGRPDDDSSGS